MREEGCRFRCFYMTTISISSSLIGILSVRELTCLWGSEADNKRLSGEGINVSWLIIWVLILAGDGHCIGPAHIRDKHLHFRRVNISVCRAAKWHKCTLTVQLTCTQTHTAPGTIQSCPVSHWPHCHTHVHCHTWTLETHTEKVNKAVNAAVWASLYEEECSWMTGVFQHVFSHLLRWASSCGKAFPLLSLTSWSKHTSQRVMIWNRYHSNENLHSNTQRWILHSGYEDMFLLDVLREVDTALSLSCLYYYNYKIH